MKLLQFLDWVPVSLLLMIALLHIGTDAQTFTSGENEYPCNCANNSTCEVSNGIINCTSGECGIINNNFSWDGIGCQWGNVALGKEATQSAGSTSALLAVDGDTSRSSCTSVPHIEQQFWQVDLGDLYVVKEITIFINIYRELVDGVLHVTSHSNVSLFDESEKCNDYNVTGNPANVTITCKSEMVGQFVTIQNSIDDAEIVICELSVVGYLYHDCQHHMYGPACLMECHCEDQCDYLTGACNANCQTGYGKSENMICDVKCLDRYWGNDCNIPCNCETNCHPISGMCPGENCVPGFMGEECQQPCDNDRWGVRCNNSCYCQNNESCDKITGACNACRGGYAGPSCAYLLPNMTLVNLIISIDGKNVSIEFPRVDGVAYYELRFQDYRHNNASSWEIHDTQIKQTFEGSIVTHQINLPSYGHYIIQVVPIDLIYNISGAGSIEADVILCEDGFSGDNCQVSLPSLKNAEIAITEHLNYIYISMTNLSKVEEAIISIKVFYQLQTFRDEQEDWKEMSSNRVRRDASERIDRVEFEDGTMNSEYHLRFEPILEDGTLGTPSANIPFRSGCRFFKGQPGCNQWCQCSNEPNALCLLQCDYCYGCDEEKKLPTSRDIMADFTDVTKESFRLGMKVNPEYTELDVTEYVVEIEGQGVNNTLTEATEYMHTYTGLASATEYNLTIHPVVTDNNRATLSNPLYESVTTTTRKEGNALVLILVLALVGSAILCIIGVIIYLNVCRRRRKDIKDSSESEKVAHLYENILVTPKSRQSSLSTLKSANHVLSDDASSKDMKVNPVYSTPNLHRKTISNPIRVNDLGNSLLINIADEFESLKSYVFKDGTHTTEAALKVENAHKNRFKNIIPYDHSRVMLSTTSEVQSHESDYMNANYIDGYNKDRAFIAAQAPAEEYVGDWWRMIWESDVRMIVMLTKLIEIMRVKCCQYWPESNDASSYGNFSVNTTATTTNAFFVERHLTVSHGSQSRQIIHLQYTSWPDHGAPTTPLPLLEFYKKVKRHRDLEQSSPLLVHCSAGVGRSGTFIAINNLLDQAAAENTIDVPKCVEKLRRNRQHMVQTEVQYQFIYEALKEQLLNGGTQMNADSFKEQFDSLICDTELIKQYERLSERSPLEYSDVTADDVPLLDKENEDKVADKTVLSKGDNYMYLATTIAGNNEHINAVLCDSYSRKASFIMTQIPLEVTMADFWRLVIDNDVSGTIILGDVQNDSCYWPKAAGNSKCWPPLVVAFKSTVESNDTNLDIIDLTITNTNRTPAQTITIRQWYIKDWVSKNVGVHGKANTLIEVMSQMKLWRGDEEHDGPIIVQCPNGLDRSGIYIDTCNVLDKMQYDDDVDVYFATKLLRQARAKAIRTFQQYKDVHEIVYRSLESKA